jgi:hypothetical protein
VVGNVVGRAVGKSVGEVVGILVNFLRTPGTTSGEIKSKICLSNDVDKVVSVIFAGARVGLPVGCTVRFTLGSASVSSPSYIELTAV